MTIPLPSRPRLPSRPALPGGKKPYESPGLPKLEAGRATHDEYGLAWSWAEGLGQRQREWLAKGYEYLGYDKDIAPSRQGSFGSSGTIPEIVFFGGLIDRGLIPFQDFEYQSEALGGRRFPGGAVLDFLVYVNGLRVGVRVESVFHASDFIFAGLSKVREDAQQSIRLESSGTVDRVIGVNRQSDGYPLEGSSEVLCDADMDRVLNVV